METTTPLSTTQRVRRTLLALAGASALTVLAGGVALAAPVAEPLTICHATTSNTNPYEVRHPSMSGDVSGHGDHTGPLWNPTLKANHIEWGDVIPPFEYVDSAGVTQQFPGLNWGAFGQAIIDNGCALPPPTLTVVKSNDANADGAFHNSETTEAVGADVTFTVTVTNTSFYSVEIASITDVVGSTSIPVSCASAFVGQTLAIGESLSCVFSVAGYSPGDGESKTNEATVTVAQTGDSGNTASADDTSVVTTDVPAPPPPTISATVTKTNDADGDGVYHATETAATAGQPVPFRVVVTNTSAVTVTFSSLTDKVGAAAAAALTCSDATPATLAAGASFTCDFTGTSPAAGTSLSDTATATVHEVGDATNSDTDQATSTVATAAIPIVNDLRIVKTGSNAELEPGDQTSYTLTVYNDGNGPITPVVTDTTPAGTSLVSLTATGWTCTGSGVSCTLNADLAPGGSASISVTIALAADYAPSSLTNTGVVSPTDITPANNSSSWTNDVLHAPDLQIVKSGPAGPVDPGDGLTYTLTVTNIGNAGADSVVVSDSLPTGTTLRSLTASGWTCTGSDVACTLDSALAPAASASITVVADLAADYAPSTVVNTATVSPTDETPENNTSTVTTAVAHAPDLAVVKTGPASVVAGSGLSWTVTVTNTGNAAADSVVVTDSLPAGVTPGTVSATGWTCTGTASLSCTLDSALPPGDQAALTISATVPTGYAGTTVANTAVVGPTDATPDDNTSTATTTVTRPVVTGGGSGGGSIVVPEEPPFTGGGGQLVFTGAPLREWALLGGSLVTIGAFLLLVSRRRPVLGGPLDS